MPAGVWCFSGGSPRHPAHQKMLILPRFSKAFRKPCSGLAAVFFCQGGNLVSIKVLLRFSKGIWPPCFLPSLLMDAYKRKPTPGYMNIFHKHRTSDIFRRVCPSVEPGLYFIVVVLKNDVDAATSISHSATLVPFSSAVEFGTNCTHGSGPILY